jgi:hypothetical protein
MVLARVAKRASERERAASQAKSIFQAGGLFEGNVNMCTAVWMLFIYCALSPLFKQSRIAHDDYLSVSFFVFREASRAAAIIGLFAAEFPTLIKVWRR